MTTAEAALHLGLTPRALHRLIEQQQFAAYRTGRIIYLDRDEVERFTPGFDGDEGTHDREPRLPLVPRGDAAMSLELPD
ncbi:MAG: helix-turn-helix domain-containing protein [Acidimicrobiales bacterium]